MKRKKQRRLLLILLVILLAACIGYFFLLRYNAKKEAEEEAEETDTSVSIYPDDFDSSNISEISYDYEGTTLSFSLSDDGETWSYDSNENFPLNQSSLSGMNSQLQSLTATRQIREDLDDLEEYGLDTPVNQVTATDSDGTEFTIYFGNTNETASITYVYTSADEAVYAVDSGIVDYFSHSLLDMIEEDEFPLPDSTATYKTLAIQQGNDTTSFRFDTAGDLTLDYLNQCSWFATMDGEEFGVDDTAMSNLTTALTSLETSGCAAYDISQEEMSSYGLDNPTAVITVNYTQEETVEIESDEDSGETSEETSASDETETEEASTETVEVPYELTLKIGDAVGDYYYVTWNDLSQVYLMSTSSLETLLSCSKADLIYQEPFNFSLNSISKMDIQYQDEDFLYQIRHTTEEVESTDDDGETTTTEQEVTTYTLNGEEITSSDFTAVLGSIQNASAEKLYPSDEANVADTEDSVMVTMTLNQAERSQVKLVLTPYDNNYYALSIDGVTTFLMNKNDVAAFVQALPIE